MNKETIEWNKTIAEFGDAEFDGREWVFNGQQYKELKYHSSWDWLMPVWVKFKNIWYASDKKNTEFEGWIDSLAYYLTTSDEPQRFFERLVYAIQWYNSQSK